MNVNKEQESNKKDEGDKFSFINEQVVGNSKTGTVKFLFFLVSCGIIIGVAALLFMAFARPYFSDLFAKKGSDEKITEAVNELKGEKPSDITSSSTENDVTDNETDGETTGSIEQRRKNMEKSVVTLSIAEGKDWKEISTDYSKYSSGLIISSGKEIKILTNYSFVKDLNKVDVYIGDEYCQGLVINHSSELGLAIVSCNREDIDSDNLQGIVRAAFEEKCDCEPGESITFMGNPYGKEKFIADGSLTSVGNAYNIVDAELEIMTTDISNTGLMNGFAFDPYGNVIGMVNDELNGSEVGENVISLISVNEIRHYIDKLVNGEEITSLGILGKEVTDDVIENIDKKMPYGIYISNTEEKSPAYVAGVMNGDILVGMCGKSIKGYDDLTEILQKCNVDDEVSIEVMRKGKDNYKRIKYIVKIGGRK